MVKKSFLNEEYFIVLIPGGNVLKKALLLQKRISKHYNIYQKGNYPGLHITLDRIKREGLEKTQKIIEEILKELNFIRLKLSQYNCYHGDDNNFLVLELEETPSLLNTAGELHSRLSAEGLSTIDDYEEWKYHITLVNNRFAKNPLQKQDFTELCFLFEGEKESCSSTAEKIEIWNPVVDHKKRCLKSFNLV